MSYIYYTENIGAGFNTIYVLSVHFHCPKDKNNYKTYISDKYDKFSLFLQQGLDDKIDQRTQTSKRSSLSTKSNTKPSKVRSFQSKMADVHPQQYIIYTKKTIIGLNHFINKVW